MLAVAGGKGGVGKTTTAYGVAIALANQRRQPILVDADTDMPDLGTLTGVTPPPGIGDIAAGAKPERVAHPDSRGHGVSVVPTTPGAPIDGAISSFPTHRVVIVDCPAGASELAVTPLQAASSTLLVTTPDQESVEDTIKTAAIADAVGTDVCGVVVTHTETAPTGIGEAIGTDLVVAVPAVAGDPLVASSVRETYDRLAAHLRGKG